jgi:hypothetical protein
MTAPIISEALKMMTTRIEESAGSRNANCPETRCGKPGCGAWLTALLSLLTLNSRLRAAPRVSTAQVPVRWFKYGLASATAPVARVKSVASLYAVVLL